MLALKGAGTNYLEDVTVDSFLFQRLGNGSGTTHNIGCQGGLSAYLKVYFTPQRR